MLARVRKFREEDIVPCPDRTDSLMFAVCEAGEIIDGLLRENPKYVRKMNKESDIPLECGQCALMLLTGIEEEPKRTEASAHHIPVEINISCGYALYWHLVGDSHLEIASVGRALAFLEALCTKYKTDLDTQLDRAIQDLRDRCQN